MNGNEELKGFKGAASFVKKTVFGLSDSMTKFTSSVGKGRVTMPQITLPYQANSAQ